MASVSMSRACKRAFDILRHGAVQDTMSFADCLPRRPNDAPWAHSQRLTLMLRHLKADLVERDSSWRLVRLSTRGERGLYRLVKKEDLSAYERQRSRGNVYE